MEIECKFFRRVLQAVVPHCVHHALKGTNIIILLLLLLLFLLLGRRESARKLFFVVDSVAFSPLLLPSLTTHTHTHGRRWRGMGENWIPGGPQLSTAARLSFSWSLASEPKISAKDNVAMFPSLQQSSRLCLLPPVRSAPLTSTRSLSLSRSLLLSLSYHSSLVCRLGNTEFLISRSQTPKR